MDLDIRYVAGLFDADGWITINKWDHKGRDYIRYQLFVGLAQVHYPIIARLKIQFGGLLHRQDSASKRNSKCRIAYQWRLSSRDARQFLKDIRPWLVVKRPQADLAIEFQDHVTKHASDFKYRPHMRGELYAYREDVLARLKALKAYSYDIPNGVDPVSALKSMQS